MDLFKQICVLFVLIFVIQLETTTATSVRVYCTSNGTSPTSTHFRLLTDGDASITGIQAYNSSVISATPVALTDPGCINTTPDSGNSELYTLEISAGNCGEDTGTIQMKALGTDEYFEFICTGALPSTVTESYVAGSKVDYRRHFPNPYNIQLQVVEHGSSHAPIDVVPYRQDIKLRLIYDKEDMEDVLDNWGKSFHVAYVPHTGVTELKLQIVTRGTGALVTVVGELSGYTINEKRSVKRNTALEFVIPVEYADTASTTTSWDVESRGISITADSLIGVRAISSNGDGSSFVVIPDDALGDTYRIPYFDGPVNGEVVVVGTTDATSLAIVYSGFAIPSGLTVDGSSVTGGDVNTTFSIDRYEVLTIKCEDVCFFLQILSTDQKTFAVLYGFDNEEHPFESGSFPGHASTQLTPFRSYHDRFVLAHPTGFNGIFFIQNKIPFPVVAFSDKGVSTTLAPWYINDVLDSYDSEVELGTTDESAFYFFSIAGGSSGDPALLPIPSRAQWTSTNSFYAKYGSTYTLSFVGTNLENIEIWAADVETSLNASQVLGDQTGFTTSSIAPILGGTATYSKASVEVTLTDGNQGLVEFRAENKWDPFMLFIVEEKGTYISTYLAYGVGYPTSFQCTTTTVMRPGDGYDNDCDGLTDEERPNNIDDDSDGLVDEDLITDMTSMTSGVYITSLLVCNVDDIICRTVISNGCSVQSLQEPISSMGKFTHNTDLADVFDHLYVIDSDVFEVWRFTEDSEVIITITYKMCFGNLTRCESSCVSKRSVDDDEEMGVSLTIKIDRSGMVLNETVTDSTMRDSDNRKHACSNNPVFWVPVAILFLILLVESCATVFFVYKRSQFIKTGQLFNY